MECTPPTWLTKEYIETILQNQSTESTIKINDIKIDTPVAKGNNYMCDIYSVIVSYSEDNKLLATSLIIKAPKESGMVIELHETGAGEKEARVYNEFLPKMNKILAKHDVEYVTPNSYFSTVKNVVVLGDLRFTGYKMVDRVKQLDFPHAELTLKALARFHAASYVLHEREPKFVEEIGKDIFFRGAKEGSSVEKLVIATTKILAEELTNVPELSRFSKRLHEYSDRAWEELVNTMETKPDEFTVLIHGDCWATNMMFKYNTNQEPESVKLIDLQVTHYTSPAIDLMYFLYGNVRNDILKENWEKFIDIYLKELNDKLKEFGAKRVLSREELNKQIHDRLAYLVFVNITVLPLFVADPINCESVKIDDALTDDFKNNSYVVHYRSEPYKSIIAKRLIELEDKGCF